MLRRATPVLVVWLALTLPTGAAAATLPAGFDDVQVATVPQPTALAFTPDGLMLVTSKPGQLRVIRDGALLPTPAIDLSGRHRGRALPAPPQGAFQRLITRVSRS